MAEGRHLEKSKNGHYLGNDLTDRHKIWHNYIDPPKRIGS